MQVVWTCFPAYLTHLANLVDGKDLAEYDYRKR